MKVRITFEVSNWTLRAISQSVRVPEVGRSELRAYIKGIVQEGLEEAEAEYEPASKESGGSHA